MTELAAGFGRFLASVEPGRGARVVSCVPIAGGYSRVSARASVRWDDGTEETFILRADPPAGSGVFVTDRDAEWAVLGALPAACRVRTPSPRWYDATGEHLGTKTMVVDAAPGAVTLQTRLRTDADTHLFVDTFADVHTTPVDGLPLEHPGDWETYLDGVLDRYDRMAERYPGCAPVLRYVTAWARAHRPPPVPLGLVHGDCQPSNVLLDDSGVPLLIDWEFAHVGDPREDLGYYTQIPMAPNVYWADPEAFLARYRERTGFTEDQVNPRVVEYFLIIGMAPLYEQLLDAAAAVNGDPRPGTLAAYLVNAVSHQHDLFLNICDREGAR